MQCSGIKTKYMTQTETVLYNIYGKINVYDFYYSLYTTQI